MRLRRKREPRAYPSYRDALYHDDGEAGMWCWLERCPACGSKAEWEERVVTVIEDPEEARFQDRACDDFWFKPSAACGAYLDFDECAYVGLPYCDPNDRDDNRSLDECHRLGEIYYDLFASRCPLLGHADPASFRVEPGVRSRLSSLAEV